jgi:hypothetical protein
MKSLLNLFKCQHPAKELAVAKEATEKQHDEDFNIVTYHLFCGKCGEQIVLTHAKMVGGVEAYIERGNQKEKHHENQSH